MINVHYVMIHVIHVKDNQQIVWAVKIMTFYMKILVYNNVLNLISKDNKIHALNAMIPVALVYSHQQIA